MRHADVIPRLAAEQRGLPLLRRTRSNLGELHRDADPDFFDQLYRYGVFVTFGISAVTYVAPSAAARTEPSTAAVTE